MTKKKSEETKQEKFWVVSSTDGSIDGGFISLSFEMAKEDADENDTIHECITTKKFVQKGWEEEK